MDLLMIKLFYGSILMFTFLNSAANVGIMSEIVDIKDLGFTGAAILSTWYFYKELKKMKEDILKKESDFEKKMDLLRDKHEKEEEVLREEIKQLNIELRTKE